MSTPLASANLRANASARELNPMTTALEATAKLMSVSVMPPTAAWTITTLTSAVESFCNDCDKASWEPWTSALMMIGKFLASTLPSPMFSNMLSSFTACCFANFTSRNLPWRNKAISRALRSSETAITSSPAAGTSDRPWISTGMDGPASLQGLPFSSNMARTRPKDEPAKIMSPRRKVPDWTKMVATGPLPLSRRASITRPLAAASFGALSSRTSACNKTFSKSSSMPVPVLADTWMNGESPPYSSGTTLSATNSCFTRSGLASGLSILLIATTNGTPAALAWAIASLVCGITPSSAATTKITMSVAWAPRARIAVKASWPGVSKNVIMPRGVSTW